MKIGVGAKLSQILQFYQNIMSVLAGRDARTCKFRVASWSSYKAVRQVSGRLSRTEIMWVLKRSGILSK